MAITPHDLVVEAKSQTREINCVQALELLNEGVTVIDVREPDEFALGHLPGAVNVPRGILEFKIGGVPQAADPHAPLLLYCRTSGRAALSAVQLQKIGYSKVFSLGGGFDLWNNQQQPVVKPAPINFE